jgi:hypothetical protein
VILLLLLLLLLVALPGYQRCRRWATCDGF